MFVENVVLGAVAGGSYGISGWLKTNKETDIEKIDVWKLIRTTTIGVGLGVVAFTQGVPIQTIESTTALGFVTVVVDNLIKIARFKVLPRLQEYL